MARSSIDLPSHSYELIRPDGTRAAGEGELTIEPGFVMLRPTDAPPLVIPHEQVVALSGADYALTFELDEGGSLRVSKIGQTHGDLLIRAREARNEAWEKGLFLNGVRLVDAFEAEVTHGAMQATAEVRLYEDRLSVLPEAGDPFGLPYALARHVSFDPDSYRVSVSTDSEPLVFGMLKLRTTEFARLLGDLIAASSARTASLLAEHPPGAAATGLSELSALMGDGIAARREDIDRLVPGAWERLESLVVCSDELRQTYEFLASQSSAPDLALGIKQKRGTGEEGPGSEDPDGENEDDDADASPLFTWFFCPMPRGDGGFIAQEITSESGHATYFFRVADDDWKAALARLNRAMLSLNFKRRPIYEDVEQESKYSFAIKHLSYLRELRAAFAGRAIHTSFDAWKASVERILAS